MIFIDRSRAARVSALLTVAIALVMAAIAPAVAQDVGTAIAERLDARQLRLYRAYVRAQSAFEQRLDTYWADVEARRAERRRKRGRHIAFTPDDYVSEQPPAYSGPRLPSDIAKIIAALRPPPPPRRALPTLADFLASARTHYGFVPQRVSEAEFKRRYAREALRLGLTRTHVVEVYALETGGRGTYDMQAGIDPISRKGTAISSALGYAQLLHANSVDELVKHGRTFHDRLVALAREPGASAQRVAALRRKISALNRMLRTVRPLPKRWSAHVRFGASPRGLGIHALNLDADIGPWLQVVKLQGLVEFARKTGRMHLTGPQIELMNLAGPATGLEMMAQPGAAAPTTNFFSRAAYYRNTIVRGRDGAGLLAAIAERMRENIRHPGAQEFARIFNAVQAAARQR